MQVLENVCKMGRRVLVENPIIYTSNHFNSFLSESCWSKRWIDSDELGKIITHAFYTSWSTKGNINLTKKRYSNSSTYLHKHCDIKTYWGGGILFHLLLTTALHGGGLSTSRAYRVSPGIHGVAGCLDPRDGWGDTEKWTFLTLPRLELRPLGPSAHSHSLYRLRYRGSYMRP